MNGVAFRELNPLRMLTLCNRSEFTFLKNTWRLLLRWPRRCPQSLALPIGAGWPVVGKHRRKTPVGHSACWRDRVYFDLSATLRPCLRAIGSTRHVGPQLSSM